MKPIAYYGNLLLSGALSGTNEGTGNPVRQVADGSINLAYVMSQDSSPTLHWGQVTVQLTAAQLPTTLSLPKCLIPSGFTLKLQSMSDPDGTGTVNVITTVFSAETTRYLAEVPGGTSAALVWRVMLSGVSGLVPARTHEIQLATTRAEFAHSPQVGVGRTHVRQFSRINIPGGQPFVRRDGPALERTSYTLIEISGAENDILRNFVDAVDGGDAFTFSDDLARVYWAELMDAEPLEQDSAGVSTWSLAFQEIMVE